MNAKKRLFFFLDRIWRIFVLLAFCINPLALSASAAYAQSDSNGLISYWSFDESSGRYDVNLEIDNWIVGREIK